MSPLDPIAPTEAVSLYLESREPEVSQSTLYEHKCRLNRFIEWCDEERLTDMNDLTRRSCLEYRTHRSDEVAPSTLEHQIRTFRLFVRFCEKMAFCPEGVAASINIPTASKKSRSRSVTLDEERAGDIIDYLDSYGYCSFRHVMFSVMWYMGARIGGVRALDVQDYVRNSSDGPCLIFQHRPDTGTPLKNGWKSERKPPMGDYLDTVLCDWVADKRPDVTDEHGREPLIATKQGRPHKTTVQRHIYGLTRPCEVGKDCPHDTTPDECAAAGSKAGASQCNSSRSPHTLRRGRATRNLNDGMPKDMVGDRMDMSVEILNEHYNEQDEEDKRRLQREFLNSNSGP